MIRVFFSFLGKCKCSTTKLHPHPSPGVNIFKNITTSGSACL